jgi:hypothetical protein
MFIMPIIYIVDQFAIKFWLHMQLMGHWTLFVDEYNPKSLHIGGGTK